MSNTVVTARIASEISERLDQLAAATERSRAWLISKAIERYVAEEWEMIAYVAEGDADFREGRTVSQADMRQWVDGLERPDAAAA